MEPKKIAIACHSFRLDGGMGRYTLLLTQGLLELGYKPIVISKKFDITLPEYKKITPIKVNCKFFPSKLRDFYYNYRLGKIRKELGIDLIISCNRNEHSDIAICGGTHICFLEAMGRKPSVFDRMQISLEKAFYKNVKRIVAHSAHIKNELLDTYGIDNKKILLAYPPVSTDNFFPTDEQSRQAIRKEFGFPEDKIVFVLPSAGNHYVKGLDLIADYFSKTDLPVLLAVAGRPIPSGYKNVLYIGFQKDMRKVYQAADFTVLPSRYEAFGQVGIESLLCGTPTLLSSAVGSSEVIHENAKFTFDWSIEGDFDRALRQAVDFARSSQARLDGSKQYFSNPPCIKDHLEFILKDFI